MGTSSVDTLAQKGYVEKNGEAERWRLTYRISRRGQALAAAYRGRDTARPQRGGEGT